MGKKVTMLTVKLLDNFFHNIISFSGIFHLTVIFRCDTGLVQGLLSQHCRY